MNQTDIDAEKQRLISEFPGADEHLLKALDSMIEQAAYETVYLKGLNQKALMSGLVRYNPENPERQQALPVSAEIARHTASLTNVLDKLAKHLGVATDNEDDGMGDYE